MDEIMKAAVAAGAIRLEFVGKTSGLHYGNVQKTVRRFGKVRDDI